MDIFRGKDVIVFVDNMSALVGLIKGSCRVSDSTTLAGLTHVLIAHLGARVHFDWVPSHSNPADGLGRYGLADKMALKHRWQVEIAVLPPWRPNVHGLQTAVEDLLSRR